MLTLAAGDPMDHLLELNKLFDFIELPGFLYKDWTQGGLGISKPIIYMWIAMGLCLAVFIPMARNFKVVPRGLQSLFEPLLIFIRDDVVRATIHAPHHHGHGNGHDHGHKHGDAPSIGDSPRDPQTGPHGVHVHTTDADVYMSEAEQTAKDREFADRFLPFFWTLFFFILFCNLVGLTPHSSTPTGHISVTAALAIISAGMIMGNGIRSHGAIGYWVGLVPPTIPPFFIKIIPNPIWALVFVIELVGLLFKPGALAIRLLANMTGGHIVIATLLGFAVAMNLFHSFAGVDSGVPGGLWIGLPVALISVIVASLFTGFEIIIGFVQAYVFTLLTATFVGMAVAPEH